MNKKEKNNDYAPKNEGFILIPRVILKEISSSVEYPVNNALAFLLILYQCNYSDQKELKRGETNLNINEWSHLFCWSRWATQKFLENLIKDGVLCERYQGKKRILCVTHYEEICGKLAAHPSARAKEELKNEPTKTKIEFERFWEHYHEINHELEPSDKELAWKEWKKLTAEERTLAHENALRYYFSMTDIRHSKKAYNYLRHKSFII